MLQTVLDLLPNWSLWTMGAGGLGLVALAVLAPSLALSALLAVFNFTITATQTAWERVFWPGLKDILEDWVTIVTVATAGLLLWGSLKADFALREASLKRAMVQCQTDLKSLKGTASRIQKGMKVKPNWLEELFP